MKLGEKWHSLDPAWRFALVAFLVARLVLTAWSLVLSMLVPILLQNLDLFGAPMFAVFDLASGERYAYSRIVDESPLTFRVADAGYVIDVQTGSQWSLKDGRATAGQYAGRTLGAAAYSVEEVFPYRGVAAETNPLLSLWQRFDTNWYLAIAARGYGDDGSTVYFPLYPTLIRLVSILSGNAMLAALLISNLALIGVLAALYWLSEKLFDVDTARRSVAYLLLFPTAFFLFAGYTESLFLLFALGGFIFAAQKRWWLAALLGTLAALTRLQGVLLVIPLVFMWWQQGSERQVRSVLPAVLIPMATAVFLAWTNLSLLNTYEGQLHARFVMPWENVWASVTWLASGRGSSVDALNLLATLLLVVMMIAVWYKLPREYALFALAMVLAPLFRMTTEQPLVSMTRYALAAFPIFMLWGAWGKNAWVNRAVVYVSLPLQLYLCAQFVMWGWVA